VQLVLFFATRCHACERLHASLRRVIRERHRHRRRNEITQLQRLARIAMEGDREAVMIAQRLRDRHLVDFTVTEREPADFDFESNCHRG